MATGQPAEVHAVRRSRPGALPACRVPSQPRSDRPRARSLGGDGPPASDPAITGERRRTQRENVLGSGVGSGASHCGRQLVGDLARDRPTAASWSPIAPRCASNAAATLDAEIAPASALHSLRGRWPELRTETRPRARLRSAATGRRGSRLLRRSAELDALQLALADEVGAGEPRSARASYLPGLDIVQHGLLDDADGGALSASAVAARARGARGYYVFLDGLLAGAAHEPRRDELVMILTQSGRVHRRRRGSWSFAVARLEPGLRDAPARPSTSRRRCSTRSACRSAASSRDAS